MSNTKNIKIAGKISLLNHYLKIAFRNLLRHKTQSFISIVGLAVGFVCVTLSAIWIRYEMTYDAQHPNSENIHYVITDNRKDPKKYNAVTPALLGEKLKSLLPEIEASAPVRYWGTDQLQHNDAMIEKCFTVDNEFFDVFSVEFIHGYKNTALADQRSIVLSEKTARKLFGSPEEAMGQLITSKDVWTGDVGAEYTVTGVVKDFEHSNLQFNVLMKFIPTEDDWYNNSYATFIRLKNGTNKQAFYDKFSALTVEEMGDHHFKAVPITQMQYTYETRQQSHALPFVYIVILAGISLLLFLCALFNQLSLFVSHLLTRTREMGLRTVVGAEMKQLLGLLATEFTLVMLLAFLVGFCVMEATRPLMAQATYVQINTGQLFGAFTLFAVLGIVLSMLAALYPVWRICKVTAKASLTGKNPAGRQRLQKTLIVVQLFIGIFFLFTMTEMYRQLHFMRSKDLGFDRTRVLRIEPRREDYKAFTNNADAIMQELKTNTAIEDAVKLRMEFFTLDGANSTSFIDWEGKDKESKDMVDILRVDFNFADFFRIPMKEGRFYSEGDRQETSRYLVINEKLATIIGDPVGKTILFQGAHPEIIGVIANIQDRSLKYEVPPTAIWLDPRPSFFYIRYTPSRESDALAQVDAILKKHDIRSFAVQTMDEMLDDFSRSEIVMMRFIGLVALVCLLISVFGIYSLTLYSMERRRREVALRKIMGAEVKNILRMFFKEYVWLVLIAAVVAIPPAYYLMTRWLQGYANRIGIAWWLIAGIVLAVTVIVIVTVLQQIVKAARQNPAEVIKSE